MKIDTVALDDLRVLDLGRDLRARLGDDLARWPDLERRYALGALLDVWAVAYARGSGTLSSAHVDASALIAEFAAILARNELAEVDSDGRVYLRGTRKRLLSDRARDQRSRAGKSGGRRSGETRSKQTAKQTASPKRSKPLRSVESREALLMDRVSEGPLEKKENEDQKEREESQKGRLDRETEKRAFEVSLRVVMSAIDALVIKKNGGRPTWSANRVREISKLIRTHGAAEVERRAGHAWGDNPPGWPELWDISTFVQHFDKAFPSRRPRNANPVGTGRFEPADDIDYSTPPWED